jgi:hypothetical protein
LERKLGGKLRNTVWLAIGLVWVVAVAWGMRAVLNYENAPGAPGDPPRQWPAQSQVPRTPGLPTLVVMGHPKCPCTRATIGELALIMARLEGRVTAVAVFVRPQGVPEGWDDTDLRRSAAAIPGVRVMTDWDETETANFHAQVSGQTMLYDAQGRLQFSGGITAARGHSGDNRGRSAVVSLVSKGRAADHRTPVFGCALRSPKS